jgi:hypothetical protein
MSKWYCDHCGKMFFRMPCQTKGKLHFCSHRCKGLYYRINVSHKSGDYTQLKKLNQYAKMRKALKEGKQ